MTSTDGKTISRDRIADCILNFDIVDSKSDAKVATDDFSTACTKVLTQPDAVTVKDMN